VLNGAADVLSCIMPPTGEIVSPMNHSFQQLTMSLKAAMIATTGSLGLTAKIYAANNIDPATWALLKKLE